jgi:hypothetical protein
MPARKAEITIGADPEFFLCDEFDYEIVTALDLVEGTKEKPLRLDKSLEEGFNYHRDNVMIEVGVPPTSDTHKFTDQIATAIQWANYRVHEKSEENQSLAIYRNASVMQFEDEDLADPRAREFGCEPDNDAYEGGAQRQAPDGIMGNWRTAGGHVHIGTDVGFNCPEFIVALLCDAYIGTNDPNDGVHNGEAPYMHYRKPGLYRTKPYGIEYRTPSNNWTFNNNHAYMMGARAKAVGQYCSTENATKIRTLVENIDWMWVRSRIMGVGKHEPEALAAHRKTIKALRLLGGE